MSGWSSGTRSHQNKAVKSTVEAGANYQLHAMPLNDYRDLAFVRHRWYDLVEAPDLSAQSLRPSLKVEYRLLFIPFHALIFEHSVPRVSIPLLNFSRRLT
jgi:hypothetical protein